MHASCGCGTCAELERAAAHEQRPVHWLEPRGRRRKSWRRLTPEDLAAIACGRTGSTRWTRVLERVTCPACVDAVRAHFRRKALAFPPRLSLGEVHRAA